MMFTCPALQIGICLPLFRGPIDDLMSKILVNICIVTKGFYSNAILTLKIFKSPSVKKVTKAFCKAYGIFNFTLYLI
jgi:hypothetical protein